ncbi:22224_t:CDS:2 [Rhizophagus irregularis]|nr:22224_t:CDS:2 [Rhizophagus irregularis]
MAFQVAIEELSKQQNGLNSVYRPSSLPTSSVSSTSSTVSSTKNHKCIPENLDLDCVYNPKYTVTELISTRRKPRKQVVPPRPPNSYFLFKNCYMLELRKLGYRYAMPDICRQSKQLWTNISAEVKERYDILALQAVILHQELYPGYRFQPKKRQIFKSHVFSENSVVVDSSMLNTFNLFPQCVSEASNELPSPFNNPLDLLIYFDNYNNFNLNNGYPEYPQQFISYEDNQNAINNNQHYLL